MSSMPYGAVRRARFVRSAHDAGRIVLTGTVPNARGVLGPKQEAEMSDEAEVTKIILEALQNADINFPDIGDGTTRNAIYRDAAEGQHLGRAVLAALKAAGFEIKKKEGDVSGS